MTRSCGVTRADLDLPHHGRTAQPVRSQRARGEHHPLTLGEGEPLVSLLALILLPRRARFQQIQRLETEAATPAVADATS